LQTARFAHFELARLLCLASTRNKFLWRQALLMHIKPTATNIEPDFPVRSRAALSLQKIKKALHCRK
jgi:hypothetical protein